MIDLGTGDGKAVLHRARTEPSSFVIGLDASVAGMAQASRRAAGQPSRGGLSNAMFVLAAAERPPVELCGRADVVTITFPWGSLLRGALALDDVAAAGIAALAAPGGSVEVLVSIADRDTTALDVAPLTTRDRAAIDRRWACHGLVVTAFQHVAADDVATTRSTWARRLTAGGRAARRPVWRLAVRSPRDSAGGR